MKGSPLCAQITFEEDEAQRSALCIEAAKRLTVHQETQGTGCEYLAYLLCLP